METVPSSVGLEKGCNAWDVYPPHMKVFSTPWGSKTQHSRFHPPCYCCRDAAQSESPPLWSHPQRTDSIWPTTSSKPLTSIFCKHFIHATYSSQTMLKIEAVRTSETSETNYELVQHHIPSRMLWELTNTKQNSLSVIEHRHVPVYNYWTPSWACLIQ